MEQKEFPCSAIDCGELDALSATNKVAVPYCPADVGDSVTEMVQVPPAASELPQVVAEMAKPAAPPDRLGVIPVSVVLPVLVSVAVTGALVLLTATVPRFSPE